MNELFSERLRQLRIQRKITQKDLAHMLHSSKATISTYENGKLPPLSTLQEIASIFNVTTEFLLGLENREWVSVDGLTKKNVEKVVSLINDFRGSNKVMGE